MSKDYPPFRPTAAGLQIQNTEVVYSSDNNKPSSIPRCDQSVIYYRSPHMAPPEDGQWSTYDPVEGGGFFIRGGEHISITLDASTSTRFLLADTQCTGYPEPPRLIALSITPPFPLPASATVAIGRKCDHVWPLMQCYAHATKNYIPNGEIVLRYAHGATQLEQLIPPYNMDTYFQHYSLKGIPVPLGELHYIDPWGRGFDNRAVLISHADALRIDTNPECVLEAVEFRSVCTESVIAVAALTVVACP